MPQDLQDERRDETCDDQTEGGDKWMMREKALECDSDRRLSSSFSPACDSFSRRSDEELGFGGANESAVSQSLG